MQWRRQRRRQRRGRSPTREGQRAASSAAGRGTLISARPSMSPPVAACSASQPPSCVPCDERRDPHCEDEVAGSQGSDENDVTGMPRKRVGVNHQVYRGGVGSWWGRGVSRGALERLVCLTVRRQSSSAVQSSPAAGAQYCREIPAGSTKGRVLAATAAGHAQGEGGVFATGAKASVFVAKAVESTKQHSSVFVVAE